MTYDTLFYVWPWMGLGAGIVLVILLFGTNLLRQDSHRNRWLDPAWLAWLAATVHFSITRKNTAST